MPVTPSRKSTTLLVSDVRLLSRGGVHSNRYNRRGMTRLFATVTRCNVGRGWPCRGVRTASNSFSTHENMEVGCRSDVRGCPKCNTSVSQGIVAEPSGVSIWRWHAGASLVGRTIVLPTFTLIPMSARKFCIWEIWVCAVLSESKHVRSSTKAVVGICRVSRNNSTKLK